MREHPGTFVFGLLFVVFGAAYLLDVLDVWDIRPIRLWPVVLIAIGLVVALGGRRGDGEH
jgi:hypothetical protein